jgi:dienelactone hydrolase
MASPGDPGGAAGGLPPEGLTRREALQRLSAAMLVGFGEGDPARVDSLFEGAERMGTTGGIEAAAQVAPNLIGAYGPWAASLAPDPPELSLRRGGWDDLDAWRAAGRERLMQRLAQPDSGGVPAVTVRRSYVLDDLRVEELSWQLPYGPPTEAVLLKPRDAQGRLPAVLALHDHSGDKFFGAGKITRTGEDQHPRMVEHQRTMYEGRAWANELARLGYVVLVPDAFTFGSRRVRLRDVPERIRRGLSVEEPESDAGIDAYNQWAGGHEHIMSKSLLSAGTTWPGVFLGEDQRALDVLMARDDVDPERVGCCGLSGGGLRSAYLGGADPRIGCAVCVGMMTTWDDFVLDMSQTHTWMIYVPLLPRELDYPEILGLRAPQPTLVLNNSQDAIFTLSEMQRADRILTEVFAKAGAPDRYRASFHPGPHKFDRPMQDEAFAWFERWL